MKYGILFYIIFGLRIVANSTPDKIFVASDNNVKAYNKKGKMFLTFTSNLTEPIKSMYIMGNHMILCGNHVYNHYRDCKDIGSYLCGDTIVDVAVLCPNNVRHSIHVVLAMKIIMIKKHHSTGKSNNYYTGMFRQSSTYSRTLSC